MTLDKLSGIEIPAALPEEDEYATWERGYQARKAAHAERRSGPREPWEDKFDAAWAEWLVEHESWNAAQPPSKRSSPADVEKARQSLRGVWQDKYGKKL
ncbi:hypothetical protein MA20_26975 [Bradyrhizobium japonicum]|uniref:Uncharacterized protein n=1 Tax=Bradyrhizobium japonicum TaxID=375 RepID=A0A0A3XT13_BRAJP|nr:hypothetical protein MA20_26975 [Bradyrhizobium japonicum]